MLLSAIRPKESLAEGEVWFRAMSMDFDDAWLGFMRAMRLARRILQRSKRKGRTPPFLGTKRQE